MVCRVCVHILILNVTVSNKISNRVGMVDLVVYIDFYGKRGVHGVVVHLITLIKIYLCFGLWLIVIILWLWLLLFARYVFQGPEYKIQ